MKADDDHPAPERTLVDDDNDVPEHVAIDIPIADSVASVDVSTERRVDETRVLWQEQERQRKAVHTAKAEFVRSSQEAQQGKSFFRYDDELLHRAVADAGRWAYGTIFVELWALNDERTLLFRPEAGWWVDPVYHRDCGTDCPICRLTDSDRPDYVRPGPLTPGEGLPGALWAETGHHAKQQQRSWLGSHSSNHVRSRFRSAADVATHVFADTSAPTAAKKIVWREIKAMANDPDQPWNLRLQLLATMGLGWVAAVDFDMHRHCGIVLFMTRENVDWHRLQSDSNETYLKAASDLAAAAYALRSPRRKVVDERRHELADVLRRVKTKILALQRMGVNLEQLVRDNAAAAENANPPPAPDRLGSDQRCRAHVRTLGHHLRTTLRKTRGGGAQPPPAMDWRQTLLTFIGCFVTLLMITRLNVYLLQERGPNDAMALG